MNKRPIQAHRNQKGFTLIELLVVVLIIGILAAVAVPQYFKIVEKGRFSEASSCFSAVKGAVERLNLKNGTYTGATYAGLDVQCPAAMKYFGAPTIGVNAGGTDYTVNIVRGTAGTTSYGRYTVNLWMPTGTFSCISGAVGDCNDLLP